jgi:hypothetical protein
MRKGQGFGAATRVIFMALAAAACGASGGSSRGAGEVPPPAGPPTALPVNGGLFVPGESMRFELSLRGVIGGEAAIAVGAPGLVDDRRVLIIRSRVESAGVVAMFKEVRDDVTSWIDVDTGLPLGHLANVKFGARQSVIETRFAGGAGGSFHVEVRRSGSEVRRIYHQAMPAELAAFDGHSVVGALRAWRADEGQHAYFYVLIGRHLWQNTIRLTTRERVRTRLGRYDALRIDGVAQRLTRDLREDPKKPPRYYTVWLSDDERRLPLLVEGKTEYGEARAELVDYQAPSQLRAQR